MPQFERANVTEDGRGVLYPFTSRNRSVLSWFALRLHSNREFRVYDALLDRGIEAFLPSWSETVKWSDREKTTVRPLFPGYVFARFDESELWEVLRIPGVVCLLPNSLDPIAIEASEIENVRMVMSSQVPVSRHPYVLGDEVTMTRGPLTGVSGVIVRTQGETRLVVRIPMVCASINVKIDAADVAVCSPIK
jgi:transcription antitermination factor NusG